MKAYLYSVTILIEHNGKPFETTLIKGSYAQSDHCARRDVLDKLLKEKHQVVNIDAFKLKKQV